MSEDEEDENVRLAPNSADDAPRNTNVQGSSADDTPGRPSGLVVGVIKRNWHS